MKDHELLMAFVPRPTFLKGLAGRLVGPGGERGIGLVGPGGDGRARGRE